MKDSDEFKTIFQNADINYETGDIEQIVLNRIAAHRKQTKRLQFYRLIGKIGIGVTVFLFIAYTIVVANLQSNTASIKSGSNNIYPLIASAMVLITMAVQLELMSISKNTKS